MLVFVYYWPDINIYVFYNFYVRKIKLKFNLLFPAFVIIIILLFDKKEIDKFALLSLSREKCKTVSVNGAHDGSPAEESGKDTIDVIANFKKDCLIYYA